MIAWILLLIHMKGTMKLSYNKVSMMQPLDIHTHTFSIGFMSRPGFHICFSHSSRWNPALNVHIKIACSSVPVDLPWVGSLVVWSINFKFSSLPWLEDLFLRKITILKLLLPCQVVYSQNEPSLSLLGSTKIQTFCGHLRRDDFILQQTSCILCALQEHRFLSGVSSRFHGLLIEKTVKSKSSGYFW